MASKPLSAAMAAGSPPPAASRSASTALAWVAVSDPVGLHGQQRGRTTAGSSRRAASASVAASLAVRARASAAGDPAGDRRDHQIVEAEVDHRGDLVRLRTGRRRLAAEQFRPARARRSAGIGPRASATAGPSTAASGTSGTRSGSRK